MYGAQPAIADRGERSGSWTELELGQVWMSVLRPPGPLPVRLGPETWRLTLVSDGPLALGRDQDSTRLEPGDLVLWEPSRAGHATAVADEGAARAIVLHLPRGAVPVPDRALADLADRPVPSDTGPGALLAQFVEGLADQAAGTIPPPQAGRLGSAAVCLSAAFLADLADAGAAAAAAAAQPRTAELRYELKEYIDRHLGEPCLTPTAIAAAHHISVRYLHHLFQADGRTVGGYVREQRLERCRADLASPALARRSVSRISARWGFPDAAVFGRAFKNAYGVSPGEFRRRSLRPS
jgi:AraC-like DNA-binding protein